jgi:hypothetical protein
MGAGKRRSDGMHCNPNQFVGLGTDYGLIDRSNTGLD